MIVENNYFVYEYYIENTQEVFYVGKGKGNRAVTGKRNQFCEDMKTTHDWSHRIIYDSLSEKDAFSKEKELIKFYRDNSDFRITNQTDGGDGVSGLHHSEASKNNISEKSINRWNDESYRSRQTQYRNDPNGAYQSKEFRLKLSEKTSGKNNGNFNNRWTKEQKNHLSMLRKQNELSKGKNNPKAKKVMCIETGEIFDYIGLAKEKYSVKHEASFTVAIDCKTRTCAGLHWVSIKYENLEFFSNESNREKYYIECLIETPNMIPIIRLEDGIIYETKKQLRDILSIGQKMLNKILKTGEEYMGYHYSIIDKNSRT
ncbi:hypothetical protein [Paenibacillus donghaensis]|uniref:GIY-YIG domain-containing protein n=1 Tax=Paenibacillus donghaensis TaxID=414771 RepID=A0A2Z2KQG1_9BACL|nr:hypothetical protein [Paenibacillus donghaensis]ASA22561.1 hypothetical protein B9T62_18295 [Paenibacillus donghaensis]